MKSKPVSVHQRMPLERAIDIVEDVLGASKNAVDREFIRAAVDRTGFPEVKWYVDHTLQVMIHHGMVRRLHVGPGCLAYQRTENWSCRDEAIGLLRGPNYKKRERPRFKPDHERKRRLSAKAMQARLILGTTQPSQMRLL
jgi:hypothetical protein